MDWKEIQTEWKKEGENEQKEFSIPTEKKLESFNKELRYFQQEWGKNPSIFQSIVMLVFSALLIMGFLYKGKIEFNALDMMIFIFLPLGISNLIRARMKKNISPESNLLHYLKDLRRDLRWILAQQYGVGLLFGILVPIFALTQNTFEVEADALRIFALLIIPISIIVAALLWWFRNHHPYNIQRLYKTVNELIQDFEGEIEEKI